MLTGGLGLLLAGLQESAGVTAEISRGLVAFGYVALFGNLVQGLFATQVGQ
jgi:hypothetical protein